MTVRKDHGSDEAGFTLIEALVTLALTGLVLSALVNITSEWLPKWNRGVDRIQQSEMIGTAMQRIAADLSAAEYVSANGDRRQPLFDGSASSVTFLRTALGPNVGVGLDVVRIGETNDQGRLVTVRSRAPFGPPAAGVLPAEQIQKSDPVVLLRPPLRVFFSYAGPDRIFHDSWHNQESLPAAIMFTVGDTGTERVLSVSSVIPVHINASAASKSDASSKEGAKDAAQTGDKPANTTAQQRGL
jgi:general secretion pathway protein J